MRSPYHVTDSDSSVMNRDRWNIDFSIAFLVVYLAILLRTFSWQAIPVYEQLHRLPFRTFLATSIVITS